MAKPELAVTIGCPVAIEAERRCSVKERDGRRRVGLTVMENPVWFCIDCELCHRTLFSADPRLILIDRDAILLAAAKHDCDEREGKHND